MLARLGAVSRAITREFSRSEWTARLLRLGRSGGTAASSGLILIQIDGLSRRQLYRAIAEGRLPFLSDLLIRERYIAHPLYSGQPASTPAVQAELFYGVKTAVPAFSFRDHETGRVMVMYHPADAAEIERRLEGLPGEPLLAGGSAYSDIFTGGAAEPHYCAAGTKWTRFFRTINPLLFPLLILLHLDVAIRLVGLITAEFVLGMIDCVRGIMAGKEFSQEIIFALCRACTVIILRELVVLGAKIDVARGLPIVHINFVGYDEQAHRRGPSSAFARWALRGIDDAIGRIWRAAHRRSSRRAYDVWIYSDHGQEDAEPYPLLHGRAMEDAVRELFTQLIETEPPEPKDPQAARRAQAWHVRLRSEQAWQPMCCGAPVQVERAQADAAPLPSDQARLVVTGMGSLGHVYPPRPLTPEQRDAFAAALVDSAKIPLVLMADGAGQARAWSSDGTFQLPEDATRLFGTNHRYLDEVVRDLIEVCHHPDAGALVLCGWRKGQRPVSFPMEHGSHTGPGREETNAFALLPADAPLPPRPQAYLRPIHLRKAAQMLLGRVTEDATDLGHEICTIAPRARTVRVMTYNVHNCLGTDGKLSPDRIARVIARHRPDIVCLQEVDVGRPRSGKVDQARLIAQRLRMLVEFQPAIQLAEEQYGNAILSRYPMRVIHAGKLPGRQNWPDTEPRSALWAAVDLGGTTLQLFNCHLSIWPNERLLQAAALLGSDWLGHPDCNGPTVLCGDLNALPTSRVCQRFSRRLRDVQLHLDQHRPLHTWSGRFPMRRIDHIFMSEEISVVGIEVPNTELEKLASDHLPMIAELLIQPRASAAAPDPAMTSAPDDPTVVSNIPVDGSR